jgi:hypothetical protein
MRGVRGMNLEGNIYADNIVGSPAVTIGGFSIGGLGTYNIGEIHDGQNKLGVSPADPLLRVAGLMDCYVYIRGCRYLQIWADENVPGSVANTYNQFHLGHTFKVELKGETALSWNNENIFYGGRLNTLYIGTTTTEYNHNNNLFLFPTLEGAIDINIQAGISNKIQDARFENTDAGTIEFSSVSIDNVITTNWTGDGNPQASLRNAVNTAVLTDNGYGNIVIRNDLYLYDKHELFTLGASSSILVDGTVGANTSYISSNQKGLFEVNATDFVVGQAIAVIPGLNWIQMKTSFRDIYGSRLIPVEYGDIFAVEWEVSAPGIRWAVRVYDANHKLLGAEGATAYISSSSLAYDGAGKYRAIANLDDSDDHATGSFSAGVFSSDVKYITVHIYTGVAINIKYAAAYFYEKPSRQFRQASAVMGQNKNITLPSIPTAGYVSQGTMVTKDDGTAIYICSYQNDTTLNGAIATSGTSVTVTTIGTVANGDVVGILLDDGLTHWSVVSGLSGSTFTVAALPSAAADGNRIVFNRWATK